MSRPKTAENQQTIKPSVAQDNRTDVLENGLLVTGLKLSMSFFETFTTVCLSMSNFFVSTSDDLLLLPSLISLIAAFLRLSISSSDVESYSPTYSLSCLVVVLTLTVVATTVDSRRTWMRQLHPKTNDIDGIILSGRFFASFPVGLLFAGDALLLARIHVSDDSQLLDSTSASSPRIATSPILLCLLSTTAAIICLKSLCPSKTASNGIQTQREIQVDRDRIRRREDSHDVPSSTMALRSRVCPKTVSRVVELEKTKLELPLRLDSGTVQLRTVLLGALTVSSLGTCLQLFPESSGTYKVPFVGDSNSFTLFKHVFLFSLIFLSAIGFFSRLLFYMTNGLFSLSEIIALSLVGALLVTSSYQNLKYGVLPSDPSTTSFTSAAFIVSVFGFFVLLFLLLTVFLSYIRDHVRCNATPLDRRTAVAKHNVIKSESVKPVTRTPMTPNSSGSKITTASNSKSGKGFLPLPMPPPGPRWIKQLHVISTVLLFSLLFCSASTVNPNGLSALHSLGYFLGFPQLLRDYQVIQRLMILLFWVFSIPTSIAVIHLVSSPLEAACRDSQTPGFRLLKVVARKLYHVAFLACFFPVFFIDIHILSVGLLVTLGVLVIVEVIRVSGLPSQRLSCRVNTFFERYLDARDHRGLVVTHIYLLLGIGFPIVYELLLSHFHARPIDLLAAAQGFLAVGIGDTAAGIVGVYASGVGIAHHLPPPGVQRKTWEGSIAFFLSYLMSSVGILQWTGRTLTQRRLAALLLTSVAAASFEATTVEVDNFLLPLFSLTTYRSLQAAAQVLIPCKA